MLGIKFDYKHLLLIGAVVLGSSAVAKAGLIESTVNVAPYYPNVGTVFQDAGNRVVTDSIEYPVGSFSSYNSSWQIDVTDTQLFVTCTDVCFPFASSSFNGFILKVVSGPTILSASVDGASDFSPLSINVVNGNELDVNLSGINHANVLSSSIIDITTADATAPEPSSLLMMAAGCLAVLASRWRTRCRAVPTT